jgi:hypothetical protein
MPASSAYFAYHLRPPGARIVAAAQLAAVRRRLAGERGTVLVGPDPVRLPETLWKVLRVLGLRAVGEPGPRLACAVHWTLATVAPASTRPDAVNAGCLDISKRRVDAAMHAVLGYGAGIDATAHEGMLVAKSDENARHDGRVLQGPVTAPEPGVVHQRLVDTELSPGVLEELRVPVIAGGVPLVYRKRRPVVDRFGHGPSAASIASPREVMSRAELAAVVAVCGHVGLDFGEADVLRDRTDGRLYVVDVNRTPWGPPRALGARAAGAAVRALADAFAPAFVARRSRVSASAPFQDRGPLPLVDRGPSRYPAHRK